jgi:hypothetical protein
MVCRPVDSVTQESGVGGAHWVNRNPQPLKQPYESLDADDAGDRACYPSDAALLAENKWPELAANKPGAESKTELERTGELFSCPLPKHAKAHREEAEEDKDRRRDAMCPGAVQDTQEEDICDTEQYDRVTRQCWNGLRDAYVSRIGINRQRLGVQREAAKKNDQNPNWPVGSASSCIRKRQPGSDTALRLQRLQGQLRGHLGNRGLIVGASTVCGVS